MSSKLIKLPQMVDLAIGTVESGIINFNILNSLLHIIVNNLNMENTSIELLGILENENLLIPQNLINSTVKLTENYMSKLSQESLKQETEIDLKINKIITVENQLSAHSISIKSFKENELLKRIESLENKLKEFESTSKQTIPSGIGKKPINNSHMSNDHLEEINDDIYYAFNEYDSLKDEEQEEEEDNYNHLEGIFTSIENLKIQKADLREVQSFEQKITNLEENYIETMKEVQEMMDAKLDKCSIIDLKKFVQTHIEYFKTKLEDFSKLICEESCGTVKLLRNNKCICCGKVVTQRDRENPAYVPKLDENHGSLRYCGGSETKLDSNEKVFRSIPHIEEFFIEGNNGRLPKSSRTECLCNSKN